MQKNINAYYLLILFLTLTISINTSEQIKEKIRLGYSIYFLKGEKEIIESVKKELAFEKQKKKKSIEFTYGKTKIEISDDGKLAIPFTSDKESILIKDSLEKILFNSKELVQEQPEKVLSLDEKESEKTQLRVGSRIILGSGDDGLSSLTITYDEIIRLYSKKDHNGVSALRSSWSSSPLVLLAMNPLGMKYRLDEDKGKVFLEESEDEIKNISYFLSYKTKKEKEKFLNKLSTVKHVELLANLHLYGFTKEFGFNYFDFAEYVLERKIENLLKNQDAHSYSLSIEWFENIGALELHKRMIVKNLLRKLIRPEVLFEGSFGPTSFDNTAKKVAIRYSGINGVVVDLENRNIILEKRNISMAEMKLNPTGMYVAMRDTDDGLELINLASGNKIHRESVHFIEFDSTGTRIAIQYFGSVEIIDLISENTILRMNAHCIKFDRTGTKVAIRYKGTGKVIDLISGKIIFHEKDVEDIKFDPTGRFVITEYLDDSLKIIDLTTGETILHEKDVDDIKFDQMDTNVAIKYLSHAVKVIDPITGETILCEKDVDDIKFDQMGTNVAIKYLNHTVKVIDSITGEAILREKDVDNIKFDPTGRYVIVGFLDNSLAMIDLITRGTIFEKRNVSCMEFDSTGTYAAIQYKDHTGEIIKRENEQIIVLAKGNGIDKIKFQGGTKVLVKYCNWKMEIIDIEYYHKNIDELNPKELVMGRIIRFNA